MDPQPDPEATRRAQEFDAKIQEVLGNLGVAIAAIVTDASDQGVVRPAWERLGRSFAELLDMEPPR